MRTRMTLFIGLLASSATLAPAMAQHAGDIVLTIDNNQIVTNRSDNGTLVPDARIFPVSLGADFPNYAANPGFDCLPGTFGYPGAIGFRIHGPLLKWDGSMFVQPPPPPPDSERIAVAFSSLGPTLTPTDGSVVDGFTLSIGSNGEWHRHLEYTLTQPATDGLYLLELTLFQTPGSTNAAAESDAFWLLFNQNLSITDQTAAEQWVADNLINPHPACAADFNRVNGVTVQDIFDFLTAWLAGSTSADFNHVNGVTVQDIFDFLTAWLAGC